MNDLEQIERERLFAEHIRALKSKENSAVKSIRALGVFPDVTCCWTRFGLDSVLYREQRVLPTKNNNTKK